jgi:penicillin amidase
METASIEDFAILQMDIHSRQADVIIPLIICHDFVKEKAVEAAEILRSWDREVRADSIGAAVYEVFVIELVHALIEPLLGKDTSYYINSWLGLLRVHDVILGKPDSKLWHTAADYYGLGSDTGIETILELILTRTIEFLEKRCGKNRSRWSWGDIHTLTFKHLGAKGKIAQKLLNRGPFPLSGDNSTVNMMGFSGINRLYDTLIGPSMRLIVPLGDLDETRLMGPVGQSGHPGHPNYDDMIEPYLKGETFTFPFTRKAVEKAATRKLMLNP